MKPPFMFRLVKIWCGVCTFMLLLSISKLLKFPSEVRGLTLFIGVLPFVLMLIGTLGVHNEQRWATWLTAILLALFTVKLPVAYQRLVASGGHSGPLLVVLSILGGANTVAVAYLVRSRYCRSFQKPNEHPENPS